MVVLLAAPPGPETLLQTLQPAAPPPPPNTKKKQKKKKSHFAPFTRGDIDWALGAATRLDWALWLWVDSDLLRFLHGPPSLIVALGRSQCR